MSRERTPPLPSSDLRARVLAEIAREPAPPRATAAARRTLVQAALAAGAVVLFFATSHVHPGERPGGVLFGTTLTAALLAVVLTRGASGAWPSDHVSMLPPSTSRLSGIVMAAFGVLVLVAFAAVLLAGPFVEVEPATMRTHLACGGLAIVQGVLPFAALAWPREGSDPRSPALTGAALGAAAGAWACMLAWLRCPHVEVAHGVLAHALPALVLSGFGALVGARLLRLR